MINVTRERVYEFKLLIDKYLQINFVFFPVKQQQSINKRSYNKKLAR
jgi:hypothetical protein